MEFYVKEKKSPMNHESHTNDENSRDSGVCLDVEMDFDLSSPVVSKNRTIRRFKDNDFSPLMEGFPNLEKSPLSSATMRNLNFDASSPVASISVSPRYTNNIDTHLSVKVPRSFNTLFTSNIETKTTPETPKSRRLATQFGSLNIRTRADRKRCSPALDDRDGEATPTSKRPRNNLLSRRCQSLDFSTSNQLDKFSTEKEIAIIQALDRVSENSYLISDGSKECCLPTIPGKHQDLKSITPDTLAKVMNNDYEDVIENCFIIDCRYPYEYEGGHIQGAKNWYTKDSLIENLVNTPIQPKDVTKRTVLIFHCEFSSERGPNMSRFVRAMDRSANAERYPHLFYPEIYLLHGGYKNFFESQKEFCFPQFYTPMHHEDYRAEMKKFRVKSKSWAGEKPRVNMRRGLRF